MPDEIIKNEEIVRDEEQYSPPQTSIDLRQYTQKVSPTGLITAVNNGLSIPENQNNQLIIDSKGTVEEVPPIQPKQSEVSSQTGVDFSKFEERIFPPTKTLSEQPLGSNVPSFVVATEKKPQHDINPLHEEALQENKDRNIGFRGSFSDNGVQALKDIDTIADDLSGRNLKQLTDLMEPEEARRYEDTLREKEEKTPPTPEPRPEFIPTTPEPTPPTPEPTEEDRLAEINKTLEETNKTLKEIDLNIQTLQQQGIENLSREQMIEYIGLIQKQSELTTKTYQMQQEINRIAFENAIKMLQGTVSNPLSSESTTVDDQKGENISKVLDSAEPTPQPIVTELGTGIPEVEISPAQQSVTLREELANLEEKSAPISLKNAEITYFDIYEQREQKKRERKEKIIKITAGIVGAGVALATPTLGVAAVIGITFGGRTLGRVMQRQSEKLRSQSNSIKYELGRGDFEEMDREQKRKEFWANRLEEASAVLIGLSTGYAIGTLFEGIVGEDFHIGGNTTTETPVSTNTSASAPESGPLGGNTQFAEASTPNSTMPDATTIGASPENWLTGETFNASEFGWDYNKLGWLGDRVHLTGLGGQDGIVQGEFFQNLSNLVPRGRLVGQTNGDIVNQFLRMALNGGLDPAVAAQKAAEILLGSQ